MGVSHVKAFPLSPSLSFSFSLGQSFLSLSLPFIPAINSDESTFPPSLLLSSSFSLFPLPEGLSLTPLRLASASMDRQSPIVHLLHAPDNDDQKAPIPQRPAQQQPKRWRGSTCMTQQTVAKKAFKRQSMVVFDYDPWCHCVQYNFFFKVVLFVPDESA